MANEKDSRRQLEGIVAGDKMDKTVTVKIVRKVMHPLYKKFVKKTTKLMAHDEKNEAKSGDTVLIKEVRPMSRHKKWMLVKILKKSVETITTVDDAAGSGAK